LKSCKKQKNKTKKVKKYNVLEDIRQTAFGDGFEKGELANALKIAKGMLAKGFDLKTISELTGLTPAEIENLSND